MARFLGRLARRSGRQNQRRSDHIVYYTYPKLLFAWLLIALGYVLFLHDL